MQKIVHMLTYILFKTTYEVESSFYLRGTWNLVITSLEWVKSRAVCFQRSLHKESEKQDRRSDGGKEPWIWITLWTLWRQPTVTLTWVCESEQSIWTSWSFKKYIWPFGLFQARLTDRCLWRLILSVNLTVSRGSQNKHYYLLCLWRCIHMRSLLKSVD